MFHVKHTGDSPIDMHALERLLHAAGVDTTPEQRFLLVRHAELVQAANRNTNLTRITQPHDVLRLHIVDSLAFLPHVHTFDGPLVDIGSGPGYPGIPLAIVTGVPVTLCESNGKKARFLAEAVATLGIGAEVFHGRAEELGVSSPRIYGVAVARAVSSLASLVELAAPLLKDGGRLIALKGAVEDDESGRAERAGEMVGMRLEGLHTYAVPGGEERRTVAVFVREGRPTITLPRRVGLAQSKPLGQ